MTITQKAVTMVGVLPWIADELENLLCHEDFVIPNNYKNLPKKIEQVITSIRLTDDRIMGGAHQQMYDEQSLLNRNLRLFVIDTIETDDKFESKNAFLSQKQRLVFLTVGVEYFAKLLSELRLDPRFKKHYYDPKISNALLKIAYTIKKIVTLPNKKEENEYFYKKLTIFLQEIICDED